MSKPIRFRLNGEPITLHATEDRVLLWALRTELGLTGSKYGCGNGQCGACTVLVDGEPVRSCVSFLGDVRDKEVLTIEGLAGDGELHALQRAFIDHGGLQCGYCTPGMIMNAYGLLLRNPRPSRRAILEAMEDNLCRCGAHTRIVAAIEAASAAMGGRS